jgi:hypothetical protein
METRTCASFKQCQAALRRLAPKFAKQVQPIYEAMEWNWGNSQGEDFIPTVDNIEETLYELLDLNSCNCTTGRLVVRIDMDYTHVEFIGSFYIDP